MNDNFRFKSEDELYERLQPSKFYTPFLTFTPPDSEDWCGTDTESQWQSILNGTFKSPLYKDLSSLVSFYKDNTIKYKFNSEGFRDEEFSSKPSAVDVYLGCSHTSGIGLHRDNIWSSIVSKELDFPSINAGIGGTGCITHLRALKWLLTKFKIRNLFYFYPLSHSRWEWYDPTSPFIYTNWYPHSEDMVKPLAYDENISLLNFTFIKAIKRICYENGIKYFIEHNMPRNRYRQYSPHVSLARDGIHYGIKPHKDLANLFLKKYRNLLV